MSIQLSSRDLMDSAVQSTGLTDFGEIVFEDGLDALLHAINKKEDFYDESAQYLKATVLQVLCNRLQVTDLIRYNPEILDEEIISPIIITGLPRTGTTLLQTLIALDPACRFLRNWESALNICPPPRLLHSDTDPRIQIFHDTMEGLFQMAPVLKGINGINFMSDGTAECQNLMAHALRNLGYCAGFGLQSYGEWLLTCDMQPGYQYHKLLLKVLQWRWPNERWVLKAPMHLFALDALLEEYPDARIVFTHRDPFTAMVSGASLVYNWSTLSSKRPDKMQIGQWFPRLWDKAMQSALVARDKRNQDQFFDVLHQDLTADPVAVVGSIHEHFGLAVSRGHQKRMQAWLRDNPRSSFGKHAYTSDDFGLIRANEKKRFKFYTNRFDV